MILSKLCDKDGYDVEISGLCCNSKEVKNGDLFFVIDGYSVNGKNFVDEAVQNGAVALVCNGKLTDADIPQVIVEDVRESMALYAAKFFNYPAESLKTVFVTGTNGKTSTTHIIAAILRQAGKNVGIIGTLGAKWGENVVKLKHTTPDPIVLHGLLRQMADDKIEYVIMEASAHAIYLKKLTGIRAAVGILTNITQDHLDFFGDMENYAKTKLEFINSNACYYSIVNADNIDFIFKKPCLTFGILKPSDVFAIDIIEGERCSFVINMLDEIYNINTNLKGLFNVYNILAAASCCRVLGIRANDIAKGVADIAEIAGRFNVYNAKKGKVIIDFAHTPDSLTNLLCAVREMKPKKLICLFGCGGDRDKTKRPIMGSIAERLADYIVITSDNPRSESPSKITDDIVGGIKGEKDYITIVDRASAIAYAINLMTDGDIVVIAGKGAEDYIEENGKKRPYSDKNTLLELIGSD